MDYEARCARRREENMELMRSLEIFNIRQELDYATRSKINKSTKRCRKSNSSDGSNIKTMRRSNRLLGMEPLNYAEVDIKWELRSRTPSKKTVKERGVCDALPSSPKIKIRMENSFGAIDGVPVGTEFATRLEASRAGIHRPPVAGIHGNTQYGCYSLALSGGYEDDVDQGDTFMYTGEGGRDLKGTKVNPKNLRTAPQSKDQVLERGNLALSKNIEYGNPIRVLRGYKLKSQFAPTEGYRYDGLYRVVNYKMTTGASGFKVYKFRLVRKEGQEAAPWEKDLEI